MTEESARRRWFLTADERGNPATRIDERKPVGVGWSVGNRVEALVHGATYFRRLYAALCDAEKGHWIHFTDWRGDPDERLAGPGTEIADVLADRAASGVHVRGLMWRSHPQATRFSEEANFHLAQKANERGGEVLLDERVRRGGSHHQKLFLIRDPQTPQRDVAFVGGIDLCHSRNDDAEHRGDPQVYTLDERYGETPAWHDVQLEIRGPAVNDLAVTFRERWEDPTPLDHRNPLRRVLGRRSHEPGEPGPLPPLPDGPAPAGPHTVQVLRTYPAKRPAYPFAPRGERSIARAYEKAYGRARRLIYLEDQYFWSTEIAELLADLLRARDELHLIVVLPRFFEENGLVSAAAPRCGQSSAIDILVRAGGERVAFYDLENEAGLPIYVHAKVCVIDDVWAEVGSDNVNLRSWTHDSELSCTVLDETRDGRAPVDPAGLGDGARAFARDLRLELWREHLGVGSDAGLVDPVEGFHRWRTAAAALDAWHEGGRSGPRPPGRVRAHAPGRQPAWADAFSRPLLRYFVDPDGRPRDLRRARRF
jgi:phosphatidylserine/phosphatidylglycerophosphate/cardiolipin synthase-like enzyme